MEEKYMKIKKSWKKTNCAQPLGNPFVATQSQWVHLDKAEISTLFKTEKEWMRPKSKTNVLRKGISSMTHKDFDYVNLFFFLHNFHWHCRTFHSQKGFPLCSFLRDMKADVECRMHSNAVRAERFLRNSGARNPFNVFMYWHQPLSRRWQTGSKHGSP